MIFVKSNLEELSSENAFRNDISHILLQTVTQKNQYHSLLLQDAALPRTETTAIITATNLENR